VVEGAAVAAHLRDFTHDHLKLIAGGRPLHRFAVPLPRSANRGGIGA